MNWLDVEAGYSPPRRGGVAAASTKSCEATKEAADGVVSSAKCLGLNSFAELLLRLRPIGLALRATPAAPISERIHFYLWRVHPSSARRGIFIHTLYDRRRYRKLLYCRRSLS